MLYRRATHLRTYAGDTALPGGKWEPWDKSIEWTAVSAANWWCDEPVLTERFQRREAFEEVCPPNLCEKARD